MATWWAVYRTSDGEHRSTGRVVADPLPSGLSKKSFGSSRPDQGNVVWNPITLVFDPGPPRPDELTRIGNAAATYPDWGSMNASDKRLVRAVVWTLRAVETE